MKHVHRRLAAGAAAAVFAAVAVAAVNIGPSEAAPNCGNGYVALTYDDGPIPSNTGALLAALQSAGVRATYSTTINAIPQIVANLSSRGLCPGMISTSTGRAVAPDGTQPTGTQTPPPSGTATCTATYAQTQRWGDRFNGQVTIRAGGTAISGWTATVTVGSGQRVSATWNGSPSWDASGNVMTMRPNGNGNLPAGGSTTFGFTVMVTNGNFAAPATTCRTP